MTIGGQRRADDRLVEGAEEQRQHDREQDLHLRAVAQAQRGVVLERGRVALVGVGMLPWRSYPSFRAGSCVRPVGRLRGRGGDRVARLSRGRWRSVQIRCGGSAGRPRRPWAGALGECVEPGSSAGIGARSRRREARRAGHQRLSRDGLALHRARLVRPAAVDRTRTTRRSSGTRTRSTSPRSSMRSMIPVALDIEASRISARRPIGMRAVVTQQREHVEMGHADPEPHQALRSRAAKRADGPAEVGDRSSRAVGSPLRAGVWSIVVRMSVKYLRHVEYSVNTELSTPGGGVERAVRADDRAPDGPHLRRAAGDRPQRAEAAGFEAFFRSDHYESFPGEAGQPTTDAWTVLAGLARDTTPDRARRARLAGDVPAARQPRQGRGDRRRDERRPGRGRASGPAGTTDEHRRHGFPFPPIERAGRHARGDARDPPRPVGGAGRLVVPGHALHGR